MKQQDGFPKLEYRIMQVALLVTGVHLLLVAFAAVKLGIGVPTCVTSKSGLQDPSFTQLDKDHYETHFVASMWQFQPNKLKLKTGSTLDIFLTSKDVVHGFFITHTNVNLMAIPGTVANGNVHFSRPGVYDIVCHEYCGVGHQNMMASIEVVDDLENPVVEGIPGFSFEDPNVKNAPTQVRTPADEGKILYQMKACAACHSLDGKKGVGPSFKSLFGSHENLQDGSTPLVDEAFLKQAIVQPNSHKIQGYQPSMPGIPLKDEEVSQLIEFIKSQK